MEEASVNEKPANEYKGVEMELGKQQSMLLEKVHGSVDAARVVWSEQEQRSRALETARTSCRSTDFPFEGTWSARKLFR